MSQPNPPPIHKPAAMATTSAAPPPPAAAPATNGRSIVHYTHDSLRKAGPSIDTATISKFSSSPSTIFPTGNVVSSPATTTNFSHPQRPDMLVTPMKATDMNNPALSKSSPYEPTPPSTTTRKPPPANLRATTTPTRRGSTTPNTPMVPDTPVSPLQEHERDYVPTPTAASARPTPPSARPTPPSTNRNAAAAARGGRGGGPPPTPTTASRGGVGAASNRMPSMSAANTPTPARARVPSMAGASSTPSRTPANRTASTSGTTAGNRAVSTTAGASRPPPAGMRTVSTARTTPNTPAKGSVPPTPRSATAPRFPGRTSTGVATKPPSQPVSRTPSAPNSRPPSVTQTRSPSATMVRASPQPNTTPNNRRKPPTSGNTLNTPPSASRGASLNASPTPTANSKTTATSRNTASTHKTNTTAATSVGMAPSTAKKATTFDLPPLATSTPATVRPVLPPISIMPSKSTPALASLVKSPVVSATSSTVSDLQKRYEDQGTLDLANGNYADAEALLAKALAYADVTSNKWAISLKLSRALAEQREFAEAKAVLAAAEGELLGLTSTGNIHDDDEHEQDPVFDARMEVRLGLAGICEMAGDIDEAETKYWSVCTDTRSRYGGEHRLFLKAMLKEVELLASRREKVEETGVVIIPPTPAPITPTVAAVASTPNLALVARDVGMVSRVSNTPSPRRIGNSTPPTSGTPPRTAPRGILRDRSTSVSTPPPSMDRPGARRAVTSAEGNHRVLSAQPMVRNHSSPRLSSLQTSSVTPRLRPETARNNSTTSESAFAAARRNFSRSPGRRASVSQAASGRNSRLVSRSPSPYGANSTQPDAKRRFLARERGGVKTASSTPTAPTFAASVSGATNRGGDNGGIRDSIRNCSVSMSRTRTNTTVIGVRESVARDVNNTLAAAALLVERNREIKNRRRSRSISPGTRTPDPASVPRRRLSFTKQRPRSASQERTGRGEFQLKGLAAEMIEEARSRLRNRSNEPPASVASDPLRGETSASIRLREFARVRAETPGVGNVRDSQSDGGEPQQQQALGLGGSRARVGLSSEEYGRVMDFLNK